MLHNIKNMDTAQHQQIRLFNLLKFYFVDFLTCADDTSNRGGVASSVSERTSWALSQCGLQSIAFNSISPGLSCAAAVLSDGGNLMTLPTVQLSAHHRCIIHIPGFTAHSPPLAFVIVLHSSNATTVPTRQPHVTWEWQLFCEWIQYMRSNFDISFYLCAFLAKIVSHILYSSFSVFGTDCQCMQLITWLSIVNFLYWNVPLRHIFQDFDNTLTQIALKILRGFLTHN